MTAERIVEARRAGRPTSAVGRARLGEVEPFASFAAVPENIRALSEKLRTEQQHRAELSAHHHDLAQQLRAASSEAERASLADATREARRQLALAENATVEAAAELVAELHADRTTDAMIGAALDLSRQRAEHLVELLRGILLAGGAHRRVRDSLASFREARPGRDVGVAALGAVGEEDHGEQLGRDVEATLGALHGDVFG